MDVIGLLHTMDHRVSPGGSGSGGGLGCLVMILMGRQQAWLPNERPKTSLDEETTLYEIY